MKSFAGLLQILMIWWRNEDSQLGSVTTFSSPTKLPSTSKQVGADSYHRLTISGLVYHRFPDIVCGGHLTKRVVGLLLLLMI